MNVLIFMVIYLAITILDFYKLAKNLNMTILTNITIILKYHYVSYIYGVW